MSATKTRMNGRPKIEIGTPLYKTYSWEPWTVIGETSRSWLVRREGMRDYDPSVKIPKAALPEGWTMDRQEWEDWCYAKTYGRNIARAIEAATPAKLREIADLIGWKPTEEDERIAKLHEERRMRGSW